MLKIYLSALFISVCFLSFCSKKEDIPIVDFSKIPKPVDSTYSISKEISWSDEFETNGAPNTEIWNYDLGGGGWGNNELQTYTNNLKNARVENGLLIIEATLDGATFNSARMITKGKKDFLYGRMEVKAKLPKGRGTWPAIWTLATNDTYGLSYWPDNGELDIMEHVGYDQNVVHANIHTKAFNHVIGTNKGSQITVPNASDDFHIYAMDWTKEKITFYVDDKKYFEFKNSGDFTWEQWPFNKPQHLLLNIAVGGNWGGLQGIDTSVYPQQMLIDYVRYYKMESKVK